MLADEARQRVLEGLEFAAVDQQVGAFAGEFRGGVVENAKHRNDPRVGIGFLVMLERALVLGRRHRLEQLSGALMTAQNRVRRDLALLRRDSRAGANVVAHKNRLERKRRLRALVAVDFEVERGNDFLRRRHFVLEIGHVFQNLAGDGEPRLESLGRTEFLKQPILQRNFRHLINDWLGLLQRHLEVAVLLHLALGGFPPFLPVVGDHVGHEHVHDLVLRGFAGVAQEHDFDEVQMMQRGELAQAGKIGRLAREDVLVGDRLERFRGEREVHRVAGLALKINNQAAQHRVHGRDPPEPPTPMKAIPALGQHQQCVNVRPADFFGGDESFQFFSHSCSKWLARANAKDIIAP